MRISEFLLRLCTVLRIPGRGPINLVILRSPAGRRGDLHLQCSALGDWHAAVAARNDEVSLGDCHAAVAARTDEVFVTALRITARGPGMTRGRWRSPLRYSFNQILSSEPPRCHPGLDPGSIQFVLTVTALWIPARGQINLVILRSPVRADLHLQSSSLGVCHAAVAARNDEVSLGDCHAAVAARTDEVLSPPYGSRLGGWNDTWGH